MPQTVERFVIKHGYNYLIVANLMFLPINFYYIKINSEKILSNQLPCGCQTFEHLEMKIKEGLDVKN